MKHGTVMTDYYEVHKGRINQRLLDEIRSILQKDGVVVYATDSGYALGCLLAHPKAVDRIRNIRQLSDSHSFTILCDSIKTASLFAFMDNTAYRLVKQHVPGPYTFLLKASHRVPSKWLDKRRKVVGIRIENGELVKELLSAVGGAMITATLLLPGSEEPVHTVYDLLPQLKPLVDVILDSGTMEPHPSTIVDLSGEMPVVVREGAGPIDQF